MVYPVWKIVLKFLKKQNKSRTKLILPYNPSSNTPGCLFHGNENFSSHKKLLLNGYMCSIQKLFTNVFCEQIHCGNSHDGTLLNNKKEQTTDTPASWVNFKGAVPSERIQSPERRCYIIPFR